MSFSPADFSYDYPEELIAKHPTDKRDGSKLLVLDRQTGQSTHKSFNDITDHFSEGDVLVINNSKVFACRLHTKRATGGRQEILLLHPTGKTQGHKSEWLVLINASKKVKHGDVFEFEGLTVEINSETGNERLALIDCSQNVFETLNLIAEIPLPPYMHRVADENDKTRYQNVYAHPTGSVAAPTAGLHFTPEILEELKTKGVEVAEVTLHVGPGTFLPVRVDDIKNHNMHTESFTISEESCAIINKAKKEGRKITAVGTTSTRVLESLAQTSLELKPQTGSTNIFIYPPYKFKIVDHLITNFHLPESTLLMLISAFYDRELILKTYNEAVKQGYRLFSYGDSMLII